VAATLNQYGIPFVYEPSVKVKVNGQTRCLKPDFYLPQSNVYIEYFGRAGNDDYDQRAKQKQCIYAANGLRVIAVYPWNLVQNWPKYLLQQLKPRPAGNSARNASQPVIQRSYRPPSYTPRIDRVESVYRPRPARAYSGKSGGYRARGRRGR